MGRANVTVCAVFYLPNYPSYDGAREAEPPDRHSQAGAGNERKCRYSEMAAAPLLEPSTVQEGDGRGRNAGCPAPPAQIRTCGITAYGSYLG